MGKKDPQTVQAPDPYEVARADAMFNRIDQITPYGNLTYSGPDRNTATLSLSPELQQIFDQRLQVDNTMTGSALERLGTFDPNQIDLSQFGPIQSNIDTSGISFQGLDTSNLPGVNVPTLQGYYGPMGQLQGAANYNPSQLGIQSNVQSTSLPTYNPQGMDVQTGLSFGGPALPENIQQYQSGVEDAYFQRARRLLEPQFQRQERALRDQMANRGLPETSEAFLDQYGQFNTGRNEAFANAADQAVLMGGQEASRQLANILGVRNQGVNEALTQGQFGNQAQNQLFGQNLAGFNAQLGQAGQQFGQNLATGQFANAAQGQDMANALQNFQAGMTQAGFNNQTSQQMANMLMQQYQLNNAVAQQNFQNQSGLRNMLFGEGLAGSQANNAASQMNLALQQQMLQNQNAARSQGLQEAMGIRGNAFNELASLLGLQQVQTPQMQNYFAPGQVDVVGANQLGLQGQMFNANAANQMNAAGLGGLYGMGAAFLGGGTPLSTLLG